MLITPSAVFLASAILSLRFCNFVANVSFHLSNTFFLFAAAFEKLINLASAFFVLLSASVTEIIFFLF